MLVNKSCKKVLDKLEIENVTKTKITAKERIEKKLVEPVAFREAVIKAFVHNDYSSEVSPVFEMFSNRIVITSYGGLVCRLREEDFFDCKSLARNREIMRVFNDIGLVEHIGSGMSRILNSYDKTIFKISPNFLVVTFNYVDPLYERVNDTVNEREKALMKLITQNNRITVDKLSKELNLSISTGKRLISQLKNRNLIKKEDSDKTGRWIINSDKN
ncbi:MAG: winged helix-turn-helix transcriptional regulator [Spirochaetales bacterium]|nr:winged helix-turn-helix transcriptional regulator [Spirochaetales bacterium]